ncbi:MAG: histidine kinase, partial [Actinomycetota bacterium]
MRNDRSHFVFLVVYFAALGTAIAWLLLGLIPALAAGTGLHETMHRIGGRTGALAEIAQNAAQASHGVGSGVQVFFDYLFSAFNLSLAAVLVRLRSHDPAARLLALGLVGSAIAFNLQGHDALQVIPATWEGAVSTWHQWVHVGSGFSYMFALLLFPSGRLLDGSRPRAFLRVAAISLVGLVLLILAVSSAEDHTTGLVILFGIAIPAVGLVAQITRYFISYDDQERQQSRLMIVYLVGAALVAVPLMIFTNVSGRVPDSQTITYEVALGSPGTYYFRCDPHPIDMTGILVLDEEGGSRVVLASEDSRFDKKLITLASGTTSTIAFTNFDSDLHNVAIYRDASMSDPVFVGQEFSGQPAGADAFRIFRIVFSLIPIVLLVDLARFRLWDINRVVNRTVAYALIAGLITVSYLALVALLGAFFGTGERLDLVASIAITVAIAALFQPLRDRARKLANRIVYGKRATPYELLSEFSDRMGGRYDLQTVVPDLAKMLAAGTGAATAEVWLRIERDLVLIASWPEGERAVSIPVDDELPVLEGRDAVVPVVSGDDLLGALTITKPPGEKVTSLEERLLANAASQAGLAFRNVQLNAELRARLDELRASRQRLVAAQDAERMRLERDIHDGVQQHLVALSMKLGRAQELADEDPARARALLSEMQVDTGDTLQALRDL